MASGIRTVNCPGLSDLDFGSHMAAAGKTSACFERRAYRQPPILALAPFRRGGAQLILPLLSGRSRHKNFAFRGKSAEFRLHSGSFQRNSLHEGVHAFE